VSTENACGDPRIFEPQTTTGTISKVRTFETGATRDSDADKPDYEGFLSIPFLRAFGRYMTAHRIQPDGNVRASDNWQKGIPRDQYIKSAFRHFMDLWELHRGGTPIDPRTRQPITEDEACCALFFNVQGYYHELERERLALDV